MAYMERKGLNMTIGNTHIANVYREERVANHQMMIRRGGAKAAIDNTDPKQSTGPVNMSKKAWLLEQQYARIEQDNVAILRKMHDILNKPAEFSRLERHGPRSMNIASRRKELERIATENQRILKSLSKIKPMFSSEALRKGAAEQEQLTLRVSQFASGRRGDPSKFQMIRPATARAQSAGASTRRPRTEGSAPQTAGLGATEPMAGEHHAQALQGQEGVRPGTAMPSYGGAPMYNMPLTMSMGGYGGYYAYNGGAPAGGAGAPGYGLSAGSTGGLGMQGGPAGHSASSGGMTPSAYGPPYGAYGATGMPPNGMYAYPPPGGSTAAPSPVSQQPSYSQQQLMMPLGYSSAGGSFMVPYGAAAYPPPPGQVAGGSSSMYGISPRPGQAPLYSPHTAQSIMMGGNTSRSEYPGSARGPEPAPAPLSSAPASSSHSASNHGSHHGTSAAAEAHSSSGASISSPGAASSSAASARQAAPAPVLVQQTVTHVSIAPAPAPVPAPAPAPAPAPVPAAAAPELSQTSKVAAVPARNGPSRGVVLARAPSAPELVKKRETEKMGASPARAVGAAGADNKSLSRTPSAPVMSGTKGLAASQPAGIQGSPIAKKTEAKPAAPAPAPAPPAAATSSAAVTAAPAAEPEVAPAAEGSGRPASARARPESARLRPGSARPGSAKGGRPESARARGGAAVYQGAPADGASMHRVDSTEAQQSQAQAAVPSTVVEETRSTASASPAVSPARAPAPAPVVGAGSKPEAPAGVVDFPMLGYAEMADSGSELGGGGSMGSSRHVMEEGSSASSSARGGQAQPSGAGQRQQGVPPTVIGAGDSIPGVDEYDSFIKEDPAGDDAESIGPDHHVPEQKD